MIVTFPPATIGRTGCTAHAGFCSSSPRRRRRVSGGAVAAVAAAAPLIPAGRLGQGVDRGRSHGPGRRRVSPPPGADGCGCGGGGWGCPVVGGRGGAAQVTAIAPSCMPIALSLSVLGAGIAVGVAGAMFEVMLNVLYGSVCFGGGCSDGGRCVDMAWMPSTRSLHGRRGVRDVHSVDWAWTLALCGFQLVLFASSFPSCRIGLLTCDVSRFRALHPSCASHACVLAWSFAFPMYIFFCCPCTPLRSSSHLLLTTTSCATTVRALAPFRASCAWASAPSQRPSHLFHSPQPPHHHLPPPLLFLLLHLFITRFPPLPRHLQDRPLRSAPCAVALGVRRADPAPVRASRGTRRGTVLSRTATRSWLVWRRKGGLRGPWQAAVQR